jgi:hypothetical protein
MFFLKKKLIPKSQSHSAEQQQQRLPVCQWSTRPLNPPSPNFLFLRPGHALPGTATAAGELFLFSDRWWRNILYVISMRDLSATRLQTSGEAPSPHFGHAGALIGDELLIWGGFTNIDTQRDGPHDDSLYLLNLGTFDLLM